MAFQSNTHNVSRSNLTETAQKGKNFFMRHTATLQSPPDLKQNDKIERMTSSPFVTGHHHSFLKNEMNSDRSPQQTSF